MTGIVRQVTAYSKISSSGYHHLIPGKTTILLVIRATAGLQRGLFRVTCSRNGQRPRPRVPIYGFMGNVRQYPALKYLKTEPFFFCSGRGKKCFLVCRAFSIPVRRLITSASSTIIENLDSMRKAGLASLAIFYFDFREDKKKDLRGLLSSLMVQLCHQSDSYCDMIFKFYSEYAKGLRHPSDDALVGCLKDLLKLPRLAPVYLVVDALDECPNTFAIPSSRTKVLSFLEELIESQIPNLRICVSSRLETDIKDILDPLIFRSVSLHDQSNQKRDIEEYINSVINTHSKSRRWNANHKQLVIDVLTEKADGM